MTLRLSTNYEGESTILVVFTPFEFITDLSPSAKPYHDNQPQ